MIPRLRALGRDLDSRSDLFSIGIVFYQLATGKNPFQFENPSTSLFKISKGDYPPLFGVCPWIPAAVEQVIEKLLTVDPKNIPSQKTCLAIGAKYVETVRIPRDHETYAEGARYRRRYRLNVRRALERLSART